MRAASRRAGSDLPRLLARRRIPVQAIWLKKYLGGIESITTTCHKKHAFASLGNTEILCVEYPPRDAAAGSRHTTCVRPFGPWWSQFAAFAGQRAQKASEGVGFVGEDAGDVFPDDDRGWLVQLLAGFIDDICKLRVFQGERAARVREAFPRTGDAESLARRAADKNVGCGCGSGEYLADDTRHVAQIRNIGVVMGKHSIRERLDFREPGRMPAERLLGQADGLDAAAHAVVLKVGGHVASPVLVGAQAPMAARSEVGRGQGEEGEEQGRWRLSASSERQGNHLWAAAGTGPSL